MQPLPGQAVKGLQPAEITGPKARFGGVPIDVPGFLIDGQRAGGVTDPAKIPAG